jgi:peptidoglycan biosynthesis protein MviN/MurJ (putative lipid II flippase)
MSQARAMRVEIREIVWLGIWILPGTLLANLGAALPQVLLVPYGEGAVSAFGYAYRFHQTAIQLLVMGMSPLLLSRFSELTADRKWAALDSLQRLALRASTIAGLVALVAVALFGETALYWLLGHGRFDAAAAARVARHWSWLTLGLGAALYGNVLAKRLQADKRTPELSLISLAGLVTLVAFAWALRPMIGEIAIPAAIVTGALITAFAMVRLIRWHRKRV